MITREEWRIISEELNSEYINMSNAYKDNSLPPPSILITKGVILILSMVAARVAERTPERTESSCILCDIPFVSGDMLQAFLRCPEEPGGSWTLPVRIDSEYQDRHCVNNDKIKRKHAHCLPTF